MSDLLARLVLGRHVQPHDYANKLLLSMLMRRMRQ